MRHAATVLFFLILCGCGSTSRDIHLGEIFFRFEIVEPMDGTPALFMSAPNGGERFVEKHRISFISPLLVQYVSKRDVFDSVLSSLQISKLSIDVYLVAMKKADGAIASLAFYDFKGGLFYPLDFRNKGWDYENKNKDIYVSALESHGIEFFQAIDLITADMLGLSDLLATNHVQKVLLSQPR